LVPQNPTIEKAIKIAGELRDQRAGMTPDQWKIEAPILIATRAKEFPESDYDRVVSILTASLGR
jgi:hypothetical protein